ncbi:hypothetical protein A5N15_03710 [Rothia kristinae]|uniref:Uncharacterized protein n=1 Tax=Rothia kristinae TaxID=37923 RepID=A0A657IV51_9MICC|nr:hypothetical protein A5N15_03710 [Rothia kristinae]
MYRRRRTTETAPISTRAATIHSGWYRPIGLMDTASQMACGPVASGFQMCSTRSAGRTTPHRIHSTPRHAAIRPSCRRNLPQPIRPAATARTCRAPRTSRIGAESTSRDISAFGWDRAMPARNGSTSSPACPVLRIRWVLTRSSCTAIARPAGSTDSPSRLG